MSILVTCPDSASIRETPSSSVLAIQTESASAADGPGAPPTGICARTSPVAGSRSPTEFSAIVASASSPAREQGDHHQSGGDDEPTDDQQRGKPSSRAARGLPWLRGRRVDGLGRRGRRWVERRILTQHRLVQVPQLGTRLDADLVDQRSPGCAVSLERLGLAPAAVERQHLQAAQALAQRMGSAISGSSSEATAA